MNIDLPIFGPRNCQALLVSLAVLLVPKLYLGTHLSAKLCFPQAEATKLRGHLHSQVQLGNEENALASQKISLRRLTRKSPQATATLAMATKRILPISQQLRSQQKKRPNKKRMPRAPAFPKHGRCCKRAHFAPRIRNVGNNRNRMNHRRGVTKDHRSAPPSRYPEHSYSTPLTPRSVYPNGKRF
jgi:hypothetical protein